MPNDVITQLRTYLDYASGETFEETLSASSSARPVVRWYQRGPLLAALTGLLVLAVAVPALLLTSTPGSPSGSELPEPLDVGVDRVWPDAGFLGSPEDIAAAFAEQALAWTNVETLSDPAASADGPVWTTIRHSGTPDLEVLSVPISEGRRALMQVGASGVSVSNEPDGAGQRIAIPQEPAAETAVLHIRFVEPSRVEVMPATASDLDKGYIEIASKDQIGGIVVVYVNDHGDAVTAIGGHFGPFDAELPAASEQAFDFFGAIASYDLSGWTSPSGGAHTIGGPSSLQLVGPATFTLSDGTTVQIPEDTPGGSLCDQLAFANDPTMPDDCVIIGEFANNSEDAAWFGLLDAQVTDDGVSVPRLVEVQNGIGMLAAFDVVFAFELADQVEYRCIDVPPGPYPADQVVLPDAATHFAVIDLNSHAIVAIECGDSS